jgi:uracil-DNA glycosylase family 4
MNLQEWGKWIEGQNPVPPRGDAWGKAAIIGEAPGREEILFQKPFVGEAGRLLSRMLNECGINEKELWIDNVCPFQPPKNDDEEIPEEAMAEYARELDERLASLPNLNLLIPLGNTALFWLTKKRGIYKWRGSLGVCEIGQGEGKRQIKYLASFHPAFLLRNPGNTGKVLSDFGRIKREIEKPEVVLGPPKRTFLIYPKAKEVEEFLGECRQAPMVSIDIETNPKERQIICVGVAPSAKLAMCIPWERKGDIELLKEFFSSEQPKVGHFASLYDNFWLSWFGIPINNLSLDTMYMHHCLNPAEDHSLAVIASLFTEEPYWKDEAIDPKEGTSARIFKPNEASYLYNCKDAAVTFEIAEILMEELKKRKKWEFYLRHYAALFPALLKMMLGGIRINAEEAQRRFGELMEELKRVEEKLGILAGENLVAKKALSRGREAKFLYETLALPKTWTKGKNLTGTKSLSTSEDTIRKLMEKFPKKLGESGPLLLEHARKQKLSTFFNPARMQEEEDVGVEGGKGMRLYFTLKPSTGTGRLASSKSPFKSGSNAQNLDRESRSIYLPEVGHLLMEIDGSQVESRMCYILTEDKELVRLANTKPWEYDAHKENAARIFEKDIGTITKAERYTAKVSVHSAQRAGTGKTLQGTFLKEQGIFKREKECQGYIDAYFRAFPAVKEYFRGIQSQLFRERKLVNRWGREITFPWERFSDEMFREAYSFPMQSDCADWMNTQGVIPLHNFIWEKGMKSRLLLTVHDSLLISLEPSEVWDLLEFIIPQLEKPIKYPAGDLVVPAEISLGKNWGDKVYEWKKIPGRDELGASVEKLKEGNNGG